MTRLAIVGLGAVTRNIHLPAYCQLATRIEIVGGSDPDPAARELATTRGVPKAFATVEELIEQTRPDLVAVCTPPALHRSHVELALAAGCHVLCEKPLADTLAEADAIVDAARRAGRMVVVNSQFPAMGIHEAARRMVGSPEFGRLLYVHGWHTMIPTAHTEAGWRGELRQRLGFEFGIHVFECIRSFFDGAVPQRVLAHMPRPEPGVSWDAINLVAMDFADGRGASFMLDRLSKGTERYLDFRLDGERAAIHTSIGGQVRAELGMHTRERRPFLDVRFVAGGQARLTNGTRSRVLAKDGQNPFASATARQLGRFLDAIESGTRPPCDAAYHRETLALVFAAYAAAERGAAVDVAEFSAAPVAAR